MFSATGPWGFGDCNSSFTGLWSVVCLNISRFFQNPYPNTCWCSQNGTYCFFPTLWKLSSNVGTCHDMFVLVCVHTHKPNYKNMVESNGGRCSVSIFEFQIWIPTFSGSSSLNPQSGAIRGAFGQTLSLISQMRKQSQSWVISLSKVKRLGNWTQNQIKFVWLFSCPSGGV